MDSLIVVEIFYFYLVKCVRLVFCIVNLSYILSMRWFSKLINNSWFFKSERVIWLIFLVIIYI